MIYKRLDDVVARLNEAGHSIKSKNQLLVKIGMKSSNASVYANGLKPISDAVINKLVLKFNINKKYLTHGEMPILSEDNRKNMPDEKIHHLTNRMQEIEVENQILKDLVDNMKETIADKNKIIFLLEQQQTVSHQS